MREATPLWSSGNCSFPTFLPLPFPRVCSPRVRDSNLKEKRSVAAPSHCPGYLQGSLPSPPLVQTSIIYWMPTEYLVLLGSLGNTKTPLLAGVPWRTGSHLVWRGGERRIQVPALGLTSKLAYLASVSSLVNQ